MGLTGKYDFKGIKKADAAGLKLAFASTPYTAWLLKWPALATLIGELLSNFLANNGLIILNVGAFYVDGKLDQKALDNAIDAGIKAVENSGGKLTPEQMKEIDDAVIAAADKALPYGKSPSKP